VINSDYKDLCSPNQPITEHLFGDDLPKIIKEVNLTNKLQKKAPRRFSNERQTYRFKPYNGFCNKKNNSFLGQGRGNLPNRYNQQRNQQTKKK